MKKNWRSAILLILEIKKSSMWPWFHSYCFFDKESISFSGFKCTVWAQA